MMPTQVGKTSFLEGIVAALSVNDPAPGMLAGPDQDDIRLVRDRFYTSCDQSPAMRGLVPPQRSRNLLWLDVNNCRWYLAWSGNPQKMSGKSCKYVVCTECDRWSQPTSEGKVHDLPRQRVLAFPSHKILFESTPNDQKSYIAHRYYNDSDQCRYLMPCPHCQHWQELRFYTHQKGPFQGRGGVAGYRDEKGNLLSVDDAYRSAHYICEQGCRIDEKARLGMVDKGRWIAKGQFIDRKGTVKGEPEKSGRVKGFTCECLVAKNVTFAKYAAEFIRTRGDDQTEQNFDNLWRARPKRLKAKVYAWKELGKKLQGAHSRTMVPAPAYFLTAGIDKQEDRCYYVVRAWGEGSTSWLVDEGQFAELLGADGNRIRCSDLQQYWDKVHTQQFQVLGGGNPVGWPFLQVYLGGVDVNYKGTEVWHWLRNKVGLRAFRGDPRTLQPFYGMNIVEKTARDGKPYEGGMELWGINTHTYKTDIRSRWTQPPEQAGAWHVLGDPLETQQSYLEHITNEVMAMHNGKPVWEAHNPKLRWDKWDCEVYARAAADMVVGHEWSGLKHMATAFHPVVSDTHDTHTEFSAR